MRILVLGGTGFIGSRVVRALGDHDVTVFHRGRTGEGRPGSELDRTGHLYGDRADLPSHRGAFRDLSPDVVLDMTAQNAEDARQTVESLAGLAARLVAVSSGSVYRSFGVLMGLEDGPIDNTPSTEEAPLRRRLFPYRGSSPRAADDPKRWLDDYDKIPAERVFLARPELPASIVRLPMVYGPGDPDRRLAGYLRRMRDRPAILLHETAAGWRNARAYVDSVAGAVARVVLCGAAGRVYNVAEPEDLTEAEWIRALGRQVGWTGTVEVVPERSRRTSPDLDELPVEACFAQHLRMDSSRIRRELGYEEPVPLAEALRRSVEDTIKERSSRS